MSSKLTIEDSTVGLAVAGGNVNNFGDIHVNCPAQVSSQLERFEEGFNIPRLITTFKGREKQIERLDFLFFKQKKRKVVVCGLPGYGKTELSKQYASKCKQNNKIDKAFWVKAENQDNLLQSFEKKLTKIYDKYKGNSKVLFIFDNATSRTAIFDYEPPDDDNFFLLITSIEKEWDIDVEPLELDPLSSDDVLGVYQSILSNNYQDEDSNLYKEIAATVGNVPLGLQITGAFVKQQRKRLGRGFNLKSYIQKLKQSTEKIFNSNIPPCTANPYQQSMHGAIRISLDKIISEKNTELRELALNILYMCCYLEPYLNLKDLLSMYISDGILTRRSYDEDEFMNALGLLDNFCFVNFNPDRKLIVMHRYTQYILQFHATQYDRPKQSKCYGVCLYYAFNITEYKDFHRRQARHIITYADDNEITVYKIYKNYLSKNENTIKTFLQDLCTTGCNKCLEIIFEKSSDPAKKYIDKYKLLHKAVYGNQSKTVKLLLDNGGDVKIKTSLFDDTPLHLAASVWNIDIIKILVEHNADLNARNDNDDIPLFSLFRSISSRAYRNIVEPNHMESVYTTALRQMYKIINFPKYTNYSCNMRIITDILDVLKCIDYKDATNKDGETFLHIVVLIGNAELAELLISKYKMDVNKTDSEDRTPLYSLISQAHDFAVNVKNVVATTRVLIMNGAKLDIKANGKNLIEISEEKDKIGILMRSLFDKKILDYLGDDRAKYYITEYKCIHYAANSGKLDILTMLLQYDVDINQMIPFSPLQVAAYGWRSDSIRILLQHNANCYASDRNGDTAIFYFVRGACKQNIIKLDKAIEILDLLKFEEQKFYSNKSGARLLHVAAAECQDELVKLLIEKYNVKTSVINKKGKTPLQYLIDNLGTKEVKKQSVINIMRVLDIRCTNANDDDIFETLKGLILFSGRDKQSILSYLK